MAEWVTQQGISPVDPILSGGHSGGEIQPGQGQEPCLHRNHRRWGLETATASTALLGWPSQALNS